MSKREIMPLSAIELNEIVEEFLNGLLEAMKSYHLQTGWIITKDEEETIEQNGLTIMVMPAWKFLLTEK